MPFVYPSDFAAETSAILDGLADKGLAGAEIYHGNLVTSIEDSVFSEAILRRNGLARADGWQVAVQFARLARNSPQVQTAADEAETNVAGVRAYLIEEVRQALDIILAERESLLYMPVPLPFFAAVDLLYRSSVMRLRLWERSQRLSQDLLDAPFRLVDPLGRFTFDVESPPVNSSALSAIRPLVDFVRNNVHAFGVDTRPEEERTPPAASSSTISGLVESVAATARAYVL